MGPLQPDRQHLIQYGGYSYGITFMAGPPGSTGAPVVVPEPDNGVVEPGPPVVEVMPEPGDVVEATPEPGNVVEPGMPVVEAMPEPGNVVEPGMPVVEATPEPDNVVEPGLSATKVRRSSSGCAIASGSAGGAGLLLLLVASMGGVALGRRRG